MAAAIMMAGSMWAQVYIETDLTSQFSNLTKTDSWTTIAGGHPGYTSENFCPKVTPNGLAEVQVCEYYASSCDYTGEVLYATVTGLSAGIYKIELYGGAAYTFGRGFTSEAFSEGTWNAGDKIEPTTEVSTGVTLYASSEDVEYGGEIPIYYATNFPEGAAVVTIDGVVVGTSGTIKIGMKKTSKSTNWHVIQLKGVTAQVKAQDLLDNVVARANAVDATNVPATVYAELQAAVEENNKTYTTATDYEAAIAAIQATLDKVSAYASAKEYLDKMDAVLEGTNVYTQESYDAQYGNWLAKYEAGTLTNEEALGLTSSKAYSTVWHSANTIDDILLSAWTIGGEQCQDYTKALNINTWSTEGDTDGSEFRVPFFEYWTSNANSLGANNLVAKVTGLDPDKFYSVEVWARVRQTNSQTKVDGSITLQAGAGLSVDLTKGTQVGTSQFYLDTFTANGKPDSDGNLTITISVAAGSNVSWLSFKNVKYSEADALDFTIYKNYLATAVENLNAVTLPTQFEGIRTAVLAKYNKDFTTADDYIEAIAAIKAATEKATHFVEVYAEYEALGEMPAGIKSLIETNANTIITTITDAESMETATTQLNELVAQGKVIAAAYTAWVEMKNGATALVAVSNDNATANSVLHSSITEQNTAVEAATTAEAIATATATLKTAVMTYVADANPTGDNKFDLTVLLTNPDVTSYWTGAWGVQPEGWYTDQEGGNFQVMANEEMGPGGEVFIEYWSENPRANDKFVLYQKITLPEGTYMMAGRLGAQQNIGGSTSGIYFAANDVLGTNIAQGPLSDASIEFVQAAEGEVKIGMKAMTGNCLRWTGINKIKLYKVAPKSFEIDETADYDATTEGAGDVDVTRTIKAGYNTLVLPFSLTQDEVEAAFGAGSKVYTIAKFEDDNISFGVQDGIFANEPVILYATAAGASYTFEGRTVVATTDPVKTVDGVKFVGNYATGYAVAKDANNYILSDGKFYLVTTDVTLKSTRAFITVPASATVAARLNISFEDGDATAIDQIATEAIAVKGIYNLQGQQLNGLQRGINIVNGKKVLVK